METKSITILQHSMTVRPYALYALMEKLEIELKLCSFVPQLTELGWALPEETAPLILLGGPQSVYEEAENPWLKDEIAFVRDCIAHGHAAFGICLGGQILSHVLGAEVKKCSMPEVGWYPVKISKTAEKLGLLPDEKHFFQWHFDGFAVPEGAEPLFEGGGDWKNQGYLWQDRVLSVQFHPEMTIEGADLLREKYAVPAGTRLQSSACLKTEFASHAPHAHNDLEKILSWLLKQKRGGQIKP